MSAIQKLKTLLTVFLSLVIGLVLYTSPIAFADSSPTLYFSSSNQRLLFGIDSDGHFVIRESLVNGSDPTGVFYLAIDNLDTTGSVVYFDIISNTSSYVFSSYRSGNINSAFVSWSSISNNTFATNSGNAVQIQSNSGSINSNQSFVFDVYVDGNKINNWSLDDGSFSDGYSSGYSDGYEVGFDSGVRSVDTQSFYTTGYNAGYSVGYSDGLSRGSSDSPLSSVNRFYNPIDNYSVNATGNTDIFINPDSFNNVWSAQDYYDLTGQTQFINTWLINTVTSSALRVTDGTFLVRAGSPFRISNIQIPKGAYPVITLHGVFVAGVGIGSNGSYAVNAPGVSGGVVYMPYSSFKLQLTRSTGISVSSLRAWFGDSNNQQFQSASTVSSANASASYIFNSVDLDCFRADFEVSVTGPDYYFVSIGYYYDDPNSNLLAEILDRLDNGNSSTSSVVDKINGAIQSFDSSVSTINDFEDSMLGSFNNSSGTVNSTVSNFSFGRQFLNAANWISSSMQRIYSSSSHFQMFWVFPIILAVALVFIGGGIGSKHD